MSMDIPPDMERAVSGIGGAMFTASLFLMRRQWAMAIVMAAGGSFIGYAFGAEFGKAWGWSAEAGSSFIGATGAITTLKLVEAIHAFDTIKAGREFWVGFLRKIGFRK